MSLYSIRVTAPINRLTGWPSNNGTVPISNALTTPHLIPGGTASVIGISRNPKRHRAFMPLPLLRIRQLSPSLPHLNTYRFRGRVAVQSGGDDNAVWEDHLG